MSGKEASSDSRDSGEQRLDRKNYPYFTDVEFITFSEEGIEFLEKAHSSCKKVYERRIAKFGLHHHEFKHPEDDLNIVLFGKTGSGKSSTANTILGKEAFIANRSSNSVTKVSLDNTCTYKNRMITVVDTPGIHNANIVKELARIAFLLQDGVHCFVICIPASDSRYTQEVKAMMKQIKQEVRGNFLDYCMLAFTKAETELETCTLREFLEEKKENESNRRFLEEIHDRVVAVNNTSLVPAEALRHRDALIEMADAVVADNIRKGNPVFYTNDLFKTAGTLHEKIASVVQGNEFHPTLINATIEAIVVNCSSMLTFEVFLEEVVSILTMRETSEISKIIPDLFIPGTTTVNDRYVNQVNQIYDQIQPEVTMFMKKITPFVLAVATGVTKTAAGAAAVTTAAARAATAAGGVAVAAAGAIVSFLFGK